MQYPGKTPDCDDGDDDDDRHRQNMESDITKDKTPDWTGRGGALGERGVIVGPPGTGGSSRGDPERSASCVKKEM